jgi:CRP-like cAMP-binding protein
VTPDEIRELPLFAGLSDVGVARVVSRAAELEAAPGVVLALAGDPGTGMFVVLEGKVSVELPGATRELGPGAVVGELALLVPEAGRVARVRAATPVRCLSLARADFEALVESEPSFALALLRELAQRLYEAHSV